MDTQVFELIYWPMIQVSREFSGMRREGTGAEVYENHCSFEDGTLRNNEAAGSVPERGGLMRYEVAFMVC